MGFIDKLGWSKKIKSIQEEPVWTSAGSFINREKPFEDVREKKFSLSVVLMSLHHQ